MKKTILFLLLSSYLCAYVGEITAIIGKSEIIRNNNIIHTFPNMKLEKQDIIYTKNGKIQIMLTDNSIIDIYKNTQIKISNYIFNHTSNSKVYLYVKKGIIKILAGQIGQLSKKNFKITTKNSTIYINHTISIINVFNNILKIQILNGNAIFIPISKHKSYIINKSKQLIYNYKNSIQIEKIFNDSIKQLNSIQKALSYAEKSNEDATIENNHYNDDSSSNDNSSPSTSTSSNDNSSPSTSTSSNNNSSPSTSTSSNNNSSPSTSTSSNNNSSPSNSNNL